MNHQRPETPPASPGLQRVLPALIAGFLLGILTTVIAAWILAPGMMLRVRPSRYANVEDTCTALQKVIEARGWQCPAVRDMNAAMAGQGVKFDRPVRIVELCKAPYARAVLTTNPEVSTLMPCAFGVYQGDDGQVYVAALNTGLLGRIFGGNVAEVMGRQVGADEQAILEAVIRP